MGLSYLSRDNDGAVMFIKGQVRKKMLITFTCFIITKNLDLEILYIREGYQLREPFDKGSVQFTFYSSSMIQLLLIVNNYTTIHN